MNDKERKKRVIRFFKKLERKLRTVKKEAEKEMKALMESKEVLK
jgi:hypothetical protein